MLNELFSGGGEVNTNIEIKMNKLTTVFMDSSFYKAMHDIMEENINNFLLLMKYPHKKTKSCMFITSV